MPKVYEKFIVPIEVIVTSVVGSVGSTSFTPVSERCYGGPSPVYQGGQSSNLELTVDGHPVVKKILFAGLPPIEKGDKIRAYVFKAEEPEDARLARAFHNVSILPIEKRVMPRYVARDFNAEEQALKIEKLFPKIFQDKVEGDHTVYLVVATYVDSDLSRLLD